MSKKIISTTNAPPAIGTYSQAVVANHCLYISGQIPLSPDTLALVEGDIGVQINQVFDNLSAICEAAGTNLGATIKFNVYLVDLKNFGKVNEIMESRLTAPYPARAMVEVSALPKASLVEIEAIVDLG